MRFIREGMFIVRQRCCLGTFSRNAFRFISMALKLRKFRSGAAETEFIVRFKGNTQRASQVYEGFEPLCAEDVADTVEYILSRPKHVCINEIHLTATAQFGGIIHRNK